MLPYFIYRPFRKRSIAKKICTLPWFQSSESYVVALGLLGVVLSVLDVMRVIKAGRTLPCVLCTSRVRSGWIVSPELERDLKLLSLFLSMEFYALLILGMTWRKCDYFIPILYYYGVVIIAEFVVLFLRLYASGLEFRKLQLLNSMFVVYNWIIVYCIYEQGFECMLGKC